MKPSLPQKPHASRARPVLRPTSQPQQPRTMRSTVLQSLLLAPGGGVPAQRHGQGAARTRTI
jgi:hypothetical protein